MGVREPTSGDRYRNVIEVGWALPDPLRRKTRRLESDATNELDLFLASVYRLGYHKLLIYPFRPSVHRSPRGQDAEMK